MKQLEDQALNVEKSAADNIYKQLPAMKELLEEYEKGCDALKEEEAKLNFEVL